MYGMNGLLGSDYLDNAVAGAEGEMNSTAEERSNSAFYNELKAAALRAHVGRHNELLRKRMGL